MTSKDLDKSLIDYLKEIPDERDSHGRRHPLWLILLIIIMAIISGYWGYRALGRFVERHRRELIEIFHISRAEVPSYSTMRRVMISLDYEELTKVFNNWASQYTHNQNGQWIAIDGKSLRNTVSDCHSSEQNFVKYLLLLPRSTLIGLELTVSSKFFVMAQEATKIINHQISLII